MTNSINNVFSKAGIPGYYLSAMALIILSSVSNSNAQWTQANLPSASIQMGAASLGSKVYFAGGKTGPIASAVPSIVINIYDVNAQMWTTGNLSVARSFPVGVSLGSKVCFAGGVNGVCYATVDIYDTITQLWTTAQLSQPRYGIAAVAYGNEILFAGGINTTLNICYNVVDKYNITTGVWSTDSLSEPKSFMGCALSGSKAYFGGGYNKATNTVSNIIDIYDFTTGTWTTDLLSVARGGLGAVAAGNKIIFAGGRTISSNLSSTVVDIYDTVSGSWSTTNLTYGRCFFNYSTSVCNKAYFIGGGGYNFTNNTWTSAFDVIDIYDPVSNGWSASTIPLHASVDLALTTNANKLYVAGGTNFGSNFNTVHIFQACSTTSIESIGNNNAISVVPNPANNFININCAALTNEEVTISVSDLMGQVIYTTKTINSENLQVNVSDFSEGVYLVQVKTKDFTGTQKVIVTR